jgi:hypothetical protein
VIVSSFDNKVLIEQIRGIESPQALADDTVGNSGGHHFEDRLLQRAQQLSKLHHLSHALTHAQRIWKLGNIVMMVFAALMGSLASLSALSGGGTLNIYWLLLVLVGFNLLSIVLWLAGVTMRSENLISGVLSNISAWGAALLGKAQSPTGKADRAWLECHFSGRVGKWRFSQITQQLWLVYLGAGLGLLLIAMMTRQFDFVWGTTLLSDQAFVQLTAILGQPLQGLGFAAPSAQQVIETRMGAGFPLSAEHRYNWAQFLLGILLVFGILPRLLLWMVSSILLRAARRQFELDEYLPYYIHLRQQLMPMHGRSEVVDADTRPLPTLQHGGADGSVHTDTTVVPGAAQWVGVELSDTIAWPLPAADKHHNAGQVVDRGSLEAIIRQVKSQKGVTLAIAVMASRPPDRGLKRIVSALSSAASDAWLVLLQPKGESTISESRLAAWYRLAQECNVPAQHVIGTTEREL